MHFLTALIICCGSLAVAFTPPPKPAVVHTVKELHDYLARLNTYYQIVQRPRFERSVMGLDNIHWAMDILDHLREETRKDLHPN